MSDVELEAAPPEAPEIFGQRWDLAQGFVDLLASEGELRGLIGPRELPRLWTRHVLNSIAVCGFIPRQASVADVGSGAGFPGVAVAIQRPDVQVQLIEPMERRVDWLNDVITELGLANASVHRGRAEEVSCQFDVVTARAVAALRKLVPWVAPLVSPGGRMLALKGERATVEVADAKKVLAAGRLDEVRVHEVLVPGTSEITRVVEALKRR